MRQTKLRIPLTIADGETIDIVGILAQQALPPHPSEPPYVAALSMGASPDKIIADASTFAQQPCSEEKPGILMRKDPFSSAPTPGGYASQVSEREVQGQAPPKPYITRYEYPTDPVDKATTNGVKIALILHGALSHKDQTYHKLLSRSLPMDSFRFDFRSNAETPGTWSIAGLDEDLEDLNAVIHYLRTTLGYVIELIIGHSRGSIDGFAWFTRHCPDSLPSKLRVPYFVALSTRFNMANIHERNTKYIPAYRKEGFYRLAVRIAGDEKEVRIYPDQIEKFATWPTAQITKDFPTKTDVLLIHGTFDKTVPVSDVMSYGNMLTGVTRRPGSCVVQLIDHADHNFRGFYPNVVAHIVQWLEERNKLAEVGLAAGTPSIAKHSHL